METMANHQFVRGHMRAAKNQTDELESASPRLAHRSVRRDLGATNPSKRSAKIDCLHSELSQRNRRTTTFSLIAMSDGATSSSERTHELGTRLDRRMHREQFAPTPTARINRIRSCCSTTAASRRTDFGSESSNRERQWTERGCIGVFMRCGSTPRQKHHLECGKASVIAVEQRSSGRAYIAYERYDSYRHEQCHLSFSFND